MFKKKNSDVQYLDEMETEEKNLLEKEESEMLWEDPIPSTASSMLEDLKETVINEDSVVEGNVRCQGKLTVLGTVHGDVVCDYELVIEGEICGNIKAKDVEINHAVIQGDIEADQECTISSGSKIIGNIKTDRGTVDGEIQGRIEAAALHVQKNAVLSGDLKVEMLSVLQGAKINGNIAMGAVSESAEK